MKKTAQYTTLFCFATCLLIAPTTVRAMDVPDIVKAAQQGNLKLVTKLITKNPTSINLLASTGVNALWVAAEQGHTDVVNFLLQHGADTTVTDELGRSPLFVAAEYAHPDTVLSLLSHGAHTRQPNNQGITPMYHVYRMLTLARSNIHHFLELLHATEKEGDAYLARFQLTFRRLFNHAEKNRLFIFPDILFQVTKLGDPRLLKKLVAYGIPDINALDPQGYTALMYAVAQGDIPMMKTLIDAGADPTKPSRKGVTTLMIATKEGNAALVEMLASQYKQLVNMQTITGDTAVQIAAQRRQYSIPDVLFRFGANPFLANNLGQNFFSYMIEDPTLRRHWKTHYEKHWTENKLNTAREVAEQDVHTRLSLSQTTPELPREIAEHISSFLEPEVDGKELQSLVHAIAPGTIDEFLKNIATIRQSINQEVTLYPEFAQQHQKEIAALEARLSAMRKELTLLRQQIKSIDPIVLKEILKTIVNYEAILKNKNQQLEALKKRRRAQVGSKSMPTSSLQK